MNWLKRFWKWLNSDNEIKLEIVEDENGEPVPSLPVCEHCGGLHVYTCPRIKVIEYYDGDFGEVKVKRVEFLDKYADKLWNITEWRD